MSILILILATLPAHAADLPSGIVGTWDSMSGNRDAAIDALVQEMSMFVRPFARTRLNRATKPCEELSFWTVGERIATRCDDEPAIIDAPDGVPIDWTSNSGETYSVSLEVRGDALVQTFSSDAGRRTNLYRVSGGKLNLQVTVSSEKLPRDLSYTRTFRKVGPATSS